MGLLLSVLALAANANAKPNIIVIITDDQGYGDFGFTGNPVLDTPHLDAFAKQSTTFDRFYVSPVCTPTRASLMTGRYAQRTGAVDTYKGRAIMRAEEVTLAEVLRDGGYATGIFGKWHLGDCYPFRAMDQGFEQSLIHRGGGLGQPSEPIDNNRRYTDPILFRNGEQVQTKGYCTDVYFDAALEFIGKQSKADEPFFAYIATNAPHGPYHDVPEKLYEKYKAKDLSPILLGNEKTVDTVARVFA
ncbi:MAG: sulfatase-like hydrolase/transferase, partial [Planctomycetota bacterium]